MTSATPLFSIIIPTYNRPQPLTRCLQALTQLDYERDRFEAIIVDDGSDLPLDPILAPLQADLNIVLIRQPNGGPASARNTGAANARGQFLVFTDDDCQPAPNWLTVLDHHFQTTPNALLGGHTLNALPDNLYSSASQALIDYLYSYYNADPTQALFFASNNMAVPAHRFQALGQFDTTFPLAAGEDREFCDRWRHHNLPMYYVPDALIYHAHHLSLGKFWQQHFNYGQGAYHFHQLRAHRGAGAIKVEPVWFYLNLLTYPWTHATAQPGVLIALLFFISQVANTIGFTWKRTQAHRSSIPPPTAP